MNSYINNSHLEELQRLLNADIFQGQAMSLTQLHGFCCALASGPRELPSTVWLTQVYGLAAPAFTSKEQELEVVASVLQFYQQVAQCLTNAEVFYPLGFDKAIKEYAELTVTDLEAWCKAYTQGAELTEHDWFATGHNDIYQLIFPIATLAGHIDKQSLANIKQQYTLEEVQQRCIQALPKATVHIYHFWRQHQHCSGHHHHHHELVRNAQAKKGRNDPCSCGSGKKYKKCCGAH